MLAATTKVMYNSSQGTRHGIATLSFSSARDLQTHTTAKTILEILPPSGHPDPSWLTGQRREGVKRACASTRIVPIVRGLQNHLKIDKFSLFKVLIFKRIGALRKRFKSSPLHLTAVCICCI